MSVCESKKKEETKKQPHNTHTHIHLHPSRKNGLDCPECGSNLLYRDGLRYTKQRPVQRWLCRNCGYRFSLRQNGYNNCQTNRDRQLCVVLKEAKKLDSATETKTVAGDKEPQQKIKGKIFEYGWHLKKQGFAESTIRNRMNILRSLVARKTNLFDSENVKETIAKVETWQNSYKKNIVNCYTDFLLWQGLSWQPPRYNVNQKIPWIPTEKEIDDLIACSGKKTGTALLIAKETGARIGEILALKWIDINKNNRTIRFNVPEKGSNPRILPISTQLVNTVERLPKTNEYLFPKGKGHAISRDYAVMLRHGRRNAAKKLGNPRLQMITYHTLRHWKGTMEYHKTKDILHVKEVLGHRNINNTMIYITLNKAIFKTSNDEFVTSVAHNVEEARKLREVGFEKYDEFDGVHLYCKRK